MHIKKLVIQGNKEEAISVDKVLLLNAGHSELTMLEELKQLGKYVITSGNLPDSFVHRYADKYVQADYSDKEKILEIARENNVKGVVSCAHDFGIITAAYVTEKLGLPGYDAYETTCLLHQKDRFKKFALENDMAVPMSYSFISEEEALKDTGEIVFPVIVKPVDLTSGMGVALAKDFCDYEIAVKTAFELSRKKAIIVEQYIKGTYHSFSTFLIDKKVVAYFSDNEYSFVNPYGVDTSVGPADEVDEVKEQLIEQSEKTAKLLNLVNGVFHMQYVLDKDKRPYIFDVTRRCSGDLYSEPVEHATGIPWAKWIVMSELGYSDNSFSERGKQQGYCGRHCILAENEGVVRKVKIDEQLEKYVYKDIKWWEPGYIVKNHKSNRLGMLFYEFPTIKERDSIVPNIKKLVTVEMMH